MIRLEANNQPLLSEFLRYLQSNLGELTDNRNNSYTEEEKLKLGRLSSAAETLASFAEEIGDSDLCLIADDFIYTVNKTSMETSFKIQPEMVKFACRLDNYEKKSAELNHTRARLWKLE